MSKLIGKQLYHQAGHDNNPVGQHKETINDNADSSEFIDK